MLEKNLEKIVKKLDGNILMIGVKYDWVIKSLLKNKDIIKCSLIETNIEGKTGKSGKDKKILLKDIKKIFGKKKIDYVICNLKEVKNELCHYIKNNIFINKQKTYLYGNVEDINLDELIYRYERYGSKVSLIINEDEFLLEIDNSNTQISKYKTIRFYSRDIFFDTFEQIEKYILK